MLAKMASDLQKPDGLTLFPDDSLPESLYRLKLEDFPGIGPRMARRLNLHGVFAVRQLCQMSEKSLCAVWKSKVLGGRWYRLLRGEDVVDGADLAADGGALAHSPSRAAHRGGRLRRPTCA